MDSVEDLDAELLAVTDRQKRSRSQDSSDASDSGGAEYEGIADSDDGDDDDNPKLSAIGNGDDDDDDDDGSEYGLDDDDDDDYASKVKKKPARASKPRKPTSKVKKPKGRAKSDRKSTVKKKPPLMPSDDDDDDEAHFQYKYDQYGYGDAADQEQLAKKTEVDRELVLEERIETRSREYLIWKKKREVMARERKKADDAGKRTARSSARMKQSSKSDALQALAEDKRNKSSRVVDMDVSDADSELDMPSRRRVTKEKVNKEENKAEPHLMRDDEQPQMRYSDFVVDRRTSPLFLRRETLIHLSQLPYFERAVMDLFTKVRTVGGHDDTYIMCKIAGVKKVNPYVLPGKLKTNWSLVLQSGSTMKSFDLRLVSSSHPSESEFGRYVSRARRAGVDILRRDEVEKLLKRSQNIIVNKKVRVTDEEQSSHIANMEIVYPDRVNWTQKRTEAKTALQIKRQDLANARDDGRSQVFSRLTAEVEELQHNLAEIKRLEEKHVQKPVESKAHVFQSLAKRNMAYNNTSDRLASKRKSLQGGKSGTNPFARFDTTGQSYYSISGKRGKKDGDKNAAPDERAEKLSAEDWRNCIVTWKPGTKRQKISDTPIDALYGVALPGLNYFYKDAEESGEEKKQPSYIAPGVDAIYAHSARKKLKLPPDAKLISFEEWSKQRVG